MSSPISTEFQQLVGLASETAQPPDEGVARQLAVLVSLQCPALCKPDPTIRHSCWSLRKAPYYATAVFVCSMIVYISSMKSRQYEAFTVLPCLWTALLLCFVNRWYEFQDLVHEIDAGLSRIEAFMLGDDEEKERRRKAYNPASFVIKKQRKGQIRSVERCAKRFWMSNWPATRLWRR
jgi:hypothetical protein